MAYDKLVDSAKLDAALKSTAGAIRAKTGGSENIPWSETEGFKSAVEGISGTSVPDGTNVTFGNEKKTVTITTPEGKAYFNGVLLPEIPADILAEYPYAWIRKDEDNRRYDLAFATGGWYYNSGLYRSVSENSPRYVLNFDDVATANEWSYFGENGNWWTITDTRAVLWSNHDIPNGSETATVIYFEGSEPITEVTETGSFPADRLEAYAILGADLNSLGAITQKMAGESALMTVADMIYWLNRVIYLQQGHATSELKLGSLKFESTVTGM